MNTNVLIIIIVIIVVLAGGWLLFTSGNKPPQNLQENLNENTADIILPTDDLGEKQEARPKTSAPVPTPKKVTVTYTNSGFSPTSIEVAVGETITFINESNHGMWIASNVHPIHTIYPTTGGCIGSSFDACESFKTGEGWSFTFDIVGSWKYHNHVNASRGGTVIVK